MSFTEVFVTRLPKHKILTTQPQWVGGADQLDFDLELHKEAGPAHLLQLTDQAVNWQNNFLWQGAFDGDYETVADEVLKAGWRNRHGASFPFFMPTWKNDLTLAVDIPATSTTITVLSINQSFLKLYNKLVNRTGRKWYQPEFSDYRWRFSLLGLLLIHNDSTGEVRRFLPIGNPGIDDDNLSPPDTQGQGAVIPNGNNLDIQLRIFATEELPAIARSEVTLLSLMYHVRFAGKVQVTYAADYVPRISATMSQVFDEAIFAPDV